MKCRNISILLAAAVCLAACAPRERVIERPLAGVRNSQTIQVDRIALTDTATIVYVDAFYNPGQWIRIDTTAYLYGGGEKYMITGAEGIELAAEHWMPESGESSFALVFEPINPKLKTIDFIEGEPDGYFKIWNIQLRGGKPSYNYRAAIPSAVRNIDYRAGTLPETGLKSAETVVKIHLLGEPKGYPMQPKFFFAGLLEIESDGSDPVSAENGTYTYNLPLYGPTQMKLNVAGNRSSFVLEPGVENNVWVDLVKLSRQGSRYDKERAGDGPAILTDGRYAAANAILANNMIDWELMSMGLLSVSPDEMSAMLEKTTAQVAADIRGLYDKKIVEINERPEYSPIEKELAADALNGDYIFGLSQLTFQLAAAQKRSLGLEWNAQLPAGVAPFEFSDSDYHTLFDGLDPAAMPNIYAGYPGYGYWGLRGKVTDIFGLKGSFSDHILATQRMMDCVERMNVPEEAQAEFDKVTEPELKDAVAMKQAVVQKKIEDAKSKTGYRICDVPQVADGELFDAIMKQYAGKVVVVDFWATWCSPCRAAMKSHEPHKDAYLGKNVAFVYLTGETSPRAQWEVAIADVRGDHYYLTDSQWRYVCDQFEVRGIPSWVVVTKKGEYLEEDMYTPEKWESVINRELAK